MAADVFSVPIFFIVFRETLEAAIIISVLLGLVEQIVHLRPDHPDLQTTSPFPTEDNDKREGDNSELASDDDASRSRLIRKMRFQECPILSTPHTTCP
jgi:high-affinity iron transporter